MSINNVERLRYLMDPTNLDICLICGGSKGDCYLTCQDCRGQCPDRDCRGKGTKSWNYDQCSDCYGFLSSLPEGRSWFVYLCDDGYIGMSSDPDERDRTHDKAGRAIIWTTPSELELNKFEAFRFEWALDKMGLVGLHGHKYLAKRFEMITGIHPSQDSLHELQQRPPLFTD